MSRRVSLPGASELFRRTEGGAPAEDFTTPAAPQAGPPAPQAAPPTPTGRVRHDEKMTVYISSDELVGLDQAKLQLRAAHGLKVDRGRIVRAAVALALADLETNGADSELVRRLQED